MNKLNEYFAEAEKGSCSTYCEGCLACITAYLIYICTETHYEKVSFSRGYEGTEHYRNYHDYYNLRGFVLKIWPSHEFSTELVMRKVLDHSDQKQVLSVRLTNEHVNFAYALAFVSCSSLQVTKALLRSRKLFFLST